MITVIRDNSYITFYDQCGRELYYVELTSMVNSAEVLDWILQINRKTWADARCMKDFLNAIEESCQMAFGNNAQGVFCPSGKGNTVTWE